MARPLQHGFNIARAHVLSRPRWASSQSAKALVEDKVPDIGMISGIPEHHLRRWVIIYSHARTATQQGDPYTNVGEAGLTFESEEAAKAFTEKHGWDYTDRVLLYYKIHDPNRIVVTVKTEKGSEVIGEESVRRILSHQNSIPHQLHHKPFGEVHLK
ncbi:hypothetical protein PS2_002075 [Malus domestica]